MSFLEKVCICEFLIAILELKETCNLTCFFKDLVIQNFTIANEEKVTENIVYRTRAINNRGYNSRILLQSALS